MTDWKEWAALIAKVLVTVAAGAGIGGIGVHQWDRGAPSRAEHELEEMRIEAEERAAMRDECQRHLDRERELHDQARAEARRFVERCTSLVTGTE